MARKNSKKTIRIGVVGVRRGSSYARLASAAGVELVALCDSWQKELIKTGKSLGATTYTDYDRFLEHDTDAVMLANYLHEHAPFAIEALKAGKHVLSETTACFTVAQAVALVREVEKSGKIYMLGENYPYRAYNQEMRRLYRAGKIGQFQYGEGEYVHPHSAHEYNQLSPGMDHWRNFRPATYYCTHALAPIMYITDTMPVKVNAFVIPYRDDDRQNALSVRRHDAASMLAVRMNDGSVVKLLQIYLQGHGNWVRVHGSLGLMENLRHTNQSMLRVRKEPFNKKRGEAVEQIYTPDFPRLQEKAMKAGHDGSDFFVLLEFAEAIREGRQPYFDVYRGVAMSVVGILGYKSALEDSASYEIPDFRKAADLKKFAGADWSPEPARHKQGQPWPSIFGDLQPSKDAKAYARKIWRKMGWVGE